MNLLLRPRNWEPACGTERSAASANYMTVLPRVLGCRTLRRTVQVRLRSNPAVPRDCTVARPPRLSEQASDGGQAHPSPRSRHGNSRNIRAGSSRVISFQSALLA